MISAVNSTAAVMCSAMGTPPPRLRWLKKGASSSHRLLNTFASEIADGAVGWHNAGIVKRTMTLARMQPDDSGTYVCVADNGVGGKDIKEVEVNVIGKTLKLQSNNFI